MKNSSKYFSFLLMGSLLMSSSFSTTHAITPIEKEQVIITFKKQADKTFVQREGGIIEETYKNLPMVAADVPVHAIDDLYENPNVESVEIDKTVKVASQSLDWGIAKTKSDVSWNYNVTGKGIKVAILDTGIKTDHPDLYVSGGYSAMSYTTSYNDDHGHGTHVAGIIGAKDNDFGVKGVAPDASLYAVKVLGGNGSGTTSEIIKGIDWAISNDMDIINMSLGSPSGTQAFQDAVDRAYQAGILLVGATGNDSYTNNVGYPARYDSVIAVGATDSYNNKATFSNAGPETEVAAPGVSIYSTLNNGSYGYMSGTSMATPYVAGVLALYKEVNPTYSNAQIRTLLTQNTIDLGTVGRDYSFGYGLVQAPQSATSVPLPPLPAIPSGFVASDITTSSAILSWNNSNGATSYELRRNGSVVYAGTNLSYADLKLSPNTSYQYTLVAKNLAGNSNISSLSFSSKAIVLAKPSNFKGTSMVTGTKLTWYKVTGATSYIVYRDGVKIYQGANSTYTDTGFEFGKTHQYGVEAVSSAGSSALSTINVLMVPSATSSFTVQPIVTTEIQMKTMWTDVSGATGYQIKVNGKVIYTRTGTIGNGYVILGYDFLPYTTYILELIPKNASGYGKPYVVTLVTPNEPPKPPTGIKTTSTSDSITLTWSSVSNAKSYTILRSDGTVITPVYNGSNLTFTDTGLLSGKQYYYTLKSVNDAGTGNPISVSVYTTPNTPSTLNGTASPTSTTLSWSSVSGATYYIVKKNGVQVYKGTKLSFVNVGLATNTAYTYTVQAGNLGGLSSPKTLSITTLPPISTSTTLTMTKPSYIMGEYATMTATVKDVTGKAVPNEYVDFKITYPNGTVKLLKAKTNMYGIATTKLLLSSTMTKGSYQVQATKTSISTSAFATSTNTKSFILQ